MRPTLLEFRSTKEKTPFYYDNKSTYDGRSLSFCSPKGDSKKSSFTHERRFIAYDILAKRTGYRVGPGAYSPETYRDKIKSGSPYKEPHGQQKTENNGYYMVGNCLEFEPALLLSSRKKLQQDITVKQDTTYLAKRGSRSAATTNHSLNFDSLKISEDNVNVKTVPFTPKTKRIKSRRNSVLRRY